jgi:quinol monooxygenase YgiN
VVDVDSVDVERYGLTGKLTAVPGKGDELLAAMLEAADLVADAPGCEMYLVSTCPDQADTVWITELWRSEADHDASLEIGGVRELITQVRPILAGPPEGTRLRPVGGKGQPPS